MTVYDYSCRVKNDLRRHVHDTDVGGVVEAGSTWGALSFDCESGQSRATGRSFWSVVTRTAPGATWPNRMCFPPSRKLHSSRGNDRIRSYYWDDGACRVGGREYLGIIESSCYQRGSLACVSCHSMHHSDPNDQLAKKMDGQEACLQCHQEFRTAIEEHTHRAASSTGSDCYNCHMPHTSYALFKGIRSHRIDSPSAANEVRTGRPNACNLCHLDRTLEWTADKLEK